MFQIKHNRINLRSSGFTIIEILVVITIIALLAGILMVAVSGARDSANSIKTTSKLKQISEWMQLWSGDHQNNILPSQFDHVDETAAGAVATVRIDAQAADDNLFDDITRGRYQGTWSDVLWTQNALHNSFGLKDIAESAQGDYYLLWSNDSPDNDIYEVYESFDHPFRSTLENTRGPEKGVQGYFAANDFFDSRSEVDSGIDDNGDGEITSSIDRYYTYSMIHAPARSVYLVDSVVGETIGDASEPWEYDFYMDDEGQLIDTQTDTNGEVDFRYGENCYFLLLDGSIASMRPWTERGPENPPSQSDRSLYGLGYRVHQLTSRKATPD